MSLSQKQIYSVNSDNAHVWEQGEDMTSLPIHIRGGLWRREGGSLTNRGLDNGIHWSQALGLRDDKLGLKCTL